MRSVKNMKMVDACRELYIKYDGRQQARIEKEMREAGFATFTRSNLHSVYVNGKRRRQGWVERFRWKEALDGGPASAGRRRLRAGFEGWLRTCTFGMNWRARHHRFICRHLKRVTEGTCRRLMIFVPPRHGKSELVTVRYAAWRMSRDPEMRIIIGCYSQSLANRFSRKVKGLVERREKLSRELHGAAEWETRAGGSVKAIGVGGGITGFGGNLIIIDDPVKSRAQSNSRTFRERTWDWYKDDIHTRLEPGGAVVLIQTRWHDDDLAGRLLKDMDDGGESWEVVRLPALAEGSDDLERQEGEALWPERFNAAALNEAKMRLGPRSFSALYQQRPVPLGGALFKPEWFTRTVSKAPDGLAWCRGYDLAVSLKDSADHTASFRVAVDRTSGIMYIADGFRKRIEYPDQRRLVIETIAREPDTRHGIELALHGKALVQDLMREPQVNGRALRGIKVEGDKLIRAEAWASYAEAGKIVLVNGPWVHDFIDEVCRFTGKGDAHDDQVDAVSLAVQMMNNSRGGYSC